MKTTTLLLGIAIGACQMNSLVCMEDTGYISMEIKEGESQLTHYTYQNFVVSHFDLRIGVDPNADYNMDEILDDLFTQQKYVSTIIQVADTLDQKIIDIENEALIKLHDDFFAKLTNYKSNNAEIMQEVERFDDHISWIMHQVPYYNREVIDRLSAFAKSNNTTL